MTSPGQAALPRGVVGRVVGAIMARLNADMEYRSVAMLEARGEERVLEIGYGPGIGVRALVTALPRGTVAGIDPSTVMRAQAQRRVARAGAVELRVGEVSSLPWPDASFDGVIAVNNAQFWPRPDSDLAELLRVLTPTGRAVIALRVGGRQGHADLVSIYTELFTEHGLVVTEESATMRTGPAVFLLARRSSSVSEP
jgi:SAM-dependent methyltransferase